MLCFIWKSELTRKKVETNSWVLQHLQVDRMGFEVLDGTKKVSEKKTVV